jgi:uncharacterized membrane protein
MAAGDAGIAEGDEPPQGGEDNSLGRLLALADGVFAIAMTLLALDLRLPDIGAHVTDGQLRHALGDQWRAYLSFVISFYVVGSYWAAHRRSMRRVAGWDASLVGPTLLVLLLVAALPFPASVLATYGDRPSALALYCVFNVALILALLQLRGRIGADAMDPTERLRMWADLAVFLLCIVGAYVLRGNAPLLLLLLLLSGRAPSLLHRGAAAG